MKQSLLSAQRLREVLHYDPETGVFTWLARPVTTHQVRTWNAKFVGSVAGSPNSGYCGVRIRGRLFYAHRLAWLYMTGEWPAAEIDHINGDPKDNRWSNLRAATPKQNQANKRRQKNNTSGFKGVSWDKDAQNWRADIRVEYRHLALGYFNTPEEAHYAYCAAAKKHFGEFARVA